MLVAEVEGEIVAHFGLLLVPLRWRGRRLTLGQTVDCYAKRRQGVVQSRIFEQLFRAVSVHFGDELDGLFGFPGERHMKLGQLRLGYAPARPVVVWRRAPRSGLQSAPQAHAWPSSDRIDRLWRTARGRLGASFERDGAQLRRRFSGRPGVEYRALTVARWWGEPESLAVVRTQRGAEQTSLLVADLLWDGRRDRGLVALDQRLDAEARGLGAEQMEMWLGGDPLAEALLASLGWRAESHPLDLGATAVSFRPDLDAAALLRELYVTMGDADLV
jgi:hypothetical protein